jgi:hypothetical protein
MRYNSDGQTFLRAGQKTKEKTLAGQYILFSNFKNRKQL